MTFQDKLTTAVNATIFAVPDLSRTAQNSLRIILLKATVPDLIEIIREEFRIQGLLKEDKK